MAVTVQSDTGTVSGANAYISVTDFKSYHGDRGNSLGTYSDTEIGQAIVRATDHVDYRFPYVGRKLNGRGQSTEWPRVDAYDPDEVLIEGVPSAVIEATAEYALRSLSSPLASDPIVSPTGYAVKSSTQIVGELEESYTYDTDKPSKLPVYPPADQKLLKAGIVRAETSGRIRRA